jgi:LysR family nitrogen assimilation transcriptional regulator
MDVVKFAQFVKIAEAGSISRAASALSIAQPALSRFVRQLEDELECTLFERNGRGVWLTDAGRRFYLHAKAILDQIETAELEAAGPSGAPLSRVTLGIAPMLAAALSPRLAAIFRARHPRVLLRIAELRSASLFHALETGQADVVIGPRDAADGSSELSPVGEDLLYYVVRRDRWAGGGLFDFGAARGIPLVMAPWPDAARRAFVTAAKARAIEPTVLCETDSLACCVDLVSSGLCAAIVPAAALPAFSADTARLGLEDLGMTYDVVVGAPLVRPLSTSARQLRDLVVEELRSAAGPLAAAGPGASRGARVHV